MTKFGGRKCAVQRLKQYKSVENVNLNWRHSLTARSALIFTHKFGRQKKNSKNFFLGQLTRLCSTVLSRFIIFQVFRVFAPRWAAVRHVKRPPMHFESLICTFRMEKRRVYVIFGEFPFSLFAELFSLV